MTPKSISITGILVADQWRIDGRVTEVALLTDDEGKYLIRHEKGHNDVLLMLRERIVVNGFLLNENGEKVIRVIDIFPARSAG